MQGLDFFRLKFSERSKIFILCNICLFIFLIPVPALAKLNLPDKWGAAFYLDQDLIVPVLNEDRDYTMGLATEFFWQDVKTGLYPLDGYIKRIGQWLGLQEKGDEIARSFILGSVTYTPDNLADPNPIYNDRPYASLLYLGNKRVRVNKNNAVGIELQVGILGSSISGNIQTDLHHFWRYVTGDSKPVDPMGWDHQISNGGELTFKMKVSNLRQLTGTVSKWDISQMYAVTLGYQTNLSIGLSARAGHIKSPPWTLPFDPVNRGNFLPAFQGNEWYGWAAYRLRLVGYDALLQGQFRHSDVTFKASDIEHILQEGGAGITFTYSSMQFTLAVNGKTPEIRAGLDHRNQYWGGMYFVYRY